MAAKKSYRDLARENARLKEALSKEVIAFRRSAEHVLNEVGDQMAHAILGQEILADAIKKVAYKERTSGETKLWFDNEWSNRHEILKQLTREHGEEVGLEKMLSILGVENLVERLGEIKEFVKVEMGDRAVQLFMIERQELDQEDAA